VFVVTVAAGASTVAAIALAPLYARRIGLRRSLGVGLTLVAASLALGAGSVARLHGLPPKDALFPCLFAMLLLGSLLILADPRRRRDDGSEDDAPDEDPPWWPDFEIALKRSARKQREPLVTG
jgi:hypothetical protein